MSERIFRQRPTGEEIEKAKQDIEELAAGHSQGFYIVVKAEPSGASQLVSNGGAFVSGMSPFDVVKIVLQAFDTDIADLLTAAIAEQSNKK